MQIATRAYEALKLAPLSCHFATVSQMLPVYCILYPCILASCLHVTVCVCACVRVYGCLRCRLLWGRGEAQALVKVNFTLCQAALYSFFPRVSVLLPTDNVFFFFEHYI